eukprot:gene15417-18247_t
MRGLQRLRLAFWMRSVEALQKWSESAAKRIFAATRDPHECALLYLALGRRTVLGGLFKAVGNTKLAEFMGRDFAQERHRTAALKNGYTLMGQGRHELAAAFFVLGGSLSDAVATLKRSSQPDPSLALLVCRLAQPAGRKDPWGPALGADGVKLVEGLLAEGPEHAAAGEGDEAVWHRAALLGLVGRHAEALAAVEEALDKGGGSSSGATQHSLGAFCVFLLKQPVVSSAVRTTSLRTSSGELDSGMLNMDSFGPSSLGGEGFLGASDLACPLVDDDPSESSNSVHSVHVRPSCTDHVSGELDFDSFGGASFGGASDLASGQLDSGALVGEDLEALAAEDSVAARGLSAAPHAARQHTAPCSTRGEEKAVENGLLTRIAAQCLVPYALQHLQLSPDHDLSQAQESAGSSSDGALPGRQLNVAELVGGTLEWSASLEGAGTPPVSLPLGIGPASMRLGAGGLWSSSHAEGVGSEGPLGAGIEVMKMTGDLLLAVAGNVVDPLQLAVATDKQGLVLAAGARSLRKGARGSSILSYNGPGRRDGEERGGWVTDFSEGLVQNSWGSSTSIMAEAPLWSTSQWPPEEWAFNDDAAALAAAATGAGNTHSPDVVAPTLAAHPRRPLLLSGSSTGMVHLWHFGQSTALAAYGVHSPRGTRHAQHSDHSIRSIRFDRYGSRFVTASATGSTATWRLEVGALGSGAPPGPTEVQQCFETRADDVMHVGSGGSVLVVAGHSAGSLESIV